MESSGRSRSAVEPMDLAFFLAWPELSTEISNQGVALIVLPLPIVRGIEQTRVSNRASNCTVLSNLRFRYENVELAFRRFLWLCRAVLAIS
jgi:hypothetical protein